MPLRRLFNGTVWYLASTGLGPSKGVLTVRTIVIDDPLRRTFSKLGEDTRRALLATYEAGSTEVTSDQIREHILGLTKERLQAALYRLEQKKFVSRTKDLTKLYRPPIWSISEDVLAFLKAEVIAGRTWGEVPVDYLAAPSIFSVGDRIQRTQRTAKGVRA
jgi:DNA-binding transcriptional ArsR family regulator